MYSRHVPIFFLKTGASFLPVPGWSLGLHIFPVGPQLGRISQAVPAAIPGGWIQPVTLGSGTLPHWDFELSFCPFLSPVHFRNITKVVIFLFWFHCH